MKSPAQLWRDWRVARAIKTLKGTRAWYDGVAGTGSSAGFAGAAVNRLTSSMAQWSGSINAELDGNLPMLRARARGLAQNNEFGQRFLTMVSANVIGPAGADLQVRAVDSKASLDKTANDAIENHWRQWGEQCDVTGVMGLADLWRVALEAVARDGEALIRKVRDRTMPYGLALQLLEADRLADTYNQRLQSGNTIRQGVETDSMSRRVAYWIYTTHPGENYNNSPPVAERVPAADIIHLYVPRRAEQVRGVTWFAPVLMRMAMLHGFEEAAVIAARVGASKVGFFERDMDSLSQSQLETLASAKDSAGHLQMNAEPGEFTELPAGYKLANWNPDYPHANFESFVKQCMRGVAAGLNVATHNLSGDMTDVNYSSARIAELAERDFWKTLQGWFARRVLMPLYREWLAGALLRGDITMDQGTPLPATRLDKFAQAARFQSRTWAWVDPLKDEEANDMRLKNGLTTRTELAALAGREFDDIVGELAQEADMLKAAGITLPLGVATTPKEGPNAVPAPPAAKDLERLKATATRLEAEMGAVVKSLARSIEAAATPREPDAVKVEVVQADNHIHLHPAPARQVERRLILDDNGRALGVTEIEIAAPGVH